MGPDCASVWEYFVYPPPAGPADALFAGDLYRVGLRKGVVFSRDGDAWSRSFVIH